MKVYLTSLDVKQDKEFFYTDQDYAPGCYKNEKNYDYEFKLYIPTDKEFLPLCNILKINRSSNPRNLKYIPNIKYISRVPIIIKIEMVIFKKAKL